MESQYEEQDEEDVWYNLDKLYKVIFVLFLFLYIIRIIHKQFNQLLLIFIVISPVQFDSLKLH